MCVCAYIQTADFSDASHLEKYWEEQELSVFMLYNNNLVHALMGVIGTGSIHAARTEFPACSRVN